MIISVFLLLIAAGGVFISSSCFIETENDIKDYLISISAPIAIFALSLHKNPLDYLKRGLEHKIFAYGLIAICLLLSTQGLLQYLGILQSNHMCFRITGSFENPAGFAAIQSLLFIVPLYCSFKNRINLYVRIVASSVAILAFVVVALSGSRCGVLAMLSAVFITSYCETDFKNQIKQHRWILFLLLLILLAFIVFLYKLKTDSANGRLFIWSICLNMIADSPLFGFGSNGFLTKYMEYQAEYFAENRLSPYSLLADNINHPFNEYLDLVVKYGLFGLAIAVYLLYLLVKTILKESKAKKTLGLSVVSTVMIMSSFSYPFNYSAFVFILIVLLIYVLPVAEPVPSRKYLWFKRMTAVLSVFMAMHFVFDCYYNMKWAAMYKRSQKGDTERMLLHYKKMKSKLLNNPYFLYNYSAELNLTGRYEDSNSIAEECLTMMNDYDVQMLLADNHFNLCNYDEALKRYETAHYMCPNRFAPMYKKFSTYKKMKDHDNMVEIGNAILDKKIKIPSREVDMMINDVRNELNNIKKVTTAE